MDETLYRKLVHTSASAYAYHRMIFDERRRPIDYQFIEINSSFERLMGVRARSVINRRASQVFKGMDEGAFSWIEFFGTITLRQGHMRVENYFHPARRWFRVEAIAVDPEHFVALYDDMTPQHDAVTELNTFFEVNLDLLCIADMDGHFVRVNRAWSDTLGYSTRELESQRFLDFIHPDDMPSTLNAMARLSQQVNVVNFVNRFRCKDGSYRHIEWRSHPKGKRIYAAARDVTDRVSSTQQLERLIGVSEVFLAHAHDEVDYQYILDNAREFAQADLGLFNRYNTSLGEFTPLAFSGDSEVLAYVEQLLGIGLLARAWPLDAKREDLLRRANVAVLPTLEEWIGDAVPAPMARVLAQTLGAGEVVVARIFDEARCIGDFTLMMPAGQPFQHLALMELYVRQVGMLFNRTRVRSRMVTHDALLTNLTNQVPGVIFQLRGYPNGELFFPYVSQGITAAFGLTPEDVHCDASRFFQRLHPDDRESLVASIRQCAESLSDWALEIRIEHPDLGTRWLRASARPEAQPDGSVLWHGYIYDITERKGHEEALIQEKNFASLVLNTMGQGLTVINATGHIEYANPEYGRLLGFAPEEMIGGYLGDFIAPESQEAFERAMAERMRGITSTYEIALRRRDGVEVPVIVNGVPLTGHGQYQGAIAVYTDISEQNRARDEIASQNRALQRANAEKDKFFSIIAHDLRSPLSGFIGLTEMLAGRIFEYNISQIQEVTSTLRVTAEGIYTLLDNLLEWSKLQRGVATFNPQEHNLAGLVSLVMEVTGLNAQAKGQEVTVDVNASTSVFADEPMIKSLLRNLLSNAIKFTPRGGQIVISAREVPGGVEITVSDSGIGIPPDILPKLFDMAHRTSRPGTEGEQSSGLGLLLCHEFITKHGGRIAVQSQEGQGASFTTLWPGPVPAERGINPSHE